MSSSAPLQRLIGTWGFEASSEGQLLGRGWTSFEWIEGGAFVRQRGDDESSPDGSPEWIAHSPMPITSILGFDDSNGEMAMLYSDARGVFRIYRMSFTDEAWTVWRDAPGFSQRFVGRFGDGDTTITGTWEMSEDGSTWTPDFDMQYRKHDSPPMRFGNEPGLQDETASILRENET
jgi:hypothetical protein